MIFISTNNQGDHVRVIGGRYEGDTGLIVRVEDNLIVLFSDLTMHELKTMPKDLQLCTDMATGTGHLDQGESEANLILNFTSTNFVNYEISEPPRFQTSQNFSKSRENRFL